MAVGAKNSVPPANPQFSERGPSLRTPQIATALSEACRAHAVQWLAVPTDLPDGWRPDGIVLVPDDGLPGAELDAVDGARTR